MMFSTQTLLSRSSSSGSVEFFDAVLLLLVITITVGMIIAIATRTAMTTMRMIIVELQGHCLDKMTATSVSHVIGRGLCAMMCKRTPCQQRALDLTVSPSLPSTELSLLSVNQKQFETARVY